MYVFTVLRIWGSFGQKLLEETQIIIVSDSELLDKLIERAIVLLKMSGVKHVIVSDNSDVRSADERSVIIIEHSIHAQVLLNNFKRSAVIIYRNTSFKSIFSKRICKIIYLKLQY